MSIWQVEIHHLTILSAAFGTADDILIVGYDLNGIDHDTTLK